MIAIYARQSIEKENSISTDSQIASCKNIIDAPADTKEYVDKGYSGSNINRPAFEQLLADIKEGQITAVYCYRLDRISRNILDFANLQEYFKKHSCSFVSSSENLDTSSPMGRAMINIIMVFAQLERETIAGRIKDSYFARAKLGAYVGGGLPFGYTTTKHDFDGKQMSVLMPDPQTAQIARDIFNMYTTKGMSLNAIVYRLNSLGVKTSTGNAFNSNSVRRILNNPVYVSAMPEIYDYYFSKGCQIYNSLDEFNGKNGCILVGKFTGKNTPNDIDKQMLIISAHKPLVDAEAFITAQHALSKNKQCKRLGTGNRTWLTGLIKCAECGFAVTTKVSKGYVYLVCRGRTNKGTSICSHSKHHTAANIEPYVEQQLFEKIKTIDPLALKASEKPIDNIELKQQLIKVNQQIETLLDSLSEAEGGAAYQLIINKIESLDATKNELAKKLEPKISTSTQKLIKTAEDIKNKWGDADIKTRNTWTGVFIKTVYISEDSINIEWKV